MATYVHYDVGGNDNFTKLLLHCDGSNNSTTISDSSLAAHGNGTANGSAKITTSTSQFGGASLSLGAAGNFVRYADSTDWQFGSGDLTIDFWTQVDAGNGSALFYQQASPTFGGGWQAGINTGLMSFLVLNTAGIVVLQRAAGSLSLPTGTWMHIAFVRATSWFLFINGVAQTITASGGADNLSIPTGSGNTLRIGGESLAGVPLIDEVRISKGFGRWNANFAPPVEPYG